MSRIDIQEVRTFQQALKRANASMRTQLERVKTVALTYAGETTLSGQAVKASKAYFRESYPTICDTLIEVLDTSEDLLERYLQDFSAQVDPSPTARVDAELLGLAVEKVKTIRSKQEALQQALSGSTAGLYEGKAQRLRLDFVKAVEQEKILERYLHFEQSHGHFFQQLHTLVMAAKNMMQRMLHEVTFNEKTGAYHLPKGFSTSLQALKRRLDDVRGIDPKLEEELMDYQVYAVVYRDSYGKDQVMWVLEQNGVGVNNAKLKNYLEKTGKYLDPSVYQIITNEELNKKINKSWEKGIYYMDGKVYKGALGATLVTSAYVEDWKGKLDESGLTDVVLGLGLSTAAIRYRQPIVKSTSREITLANLTPDVLSTKPKYSPNPSKWLNKGGKIKLNDSGTWTYINNKNQSVSYINGFPDFKGAGLVKQEVNIGKFNNYNTDFKMADELAPNGPRDPVNNTWHHKADGMTMEEVNKGIHKEFTHRGGMSIKKVRRR
ncbi:hypothetical protein MFLO_01030 [Listeria floridensis FSL S10-1187]|uniref:LXG domain-containing protein n=1 Tax=Listeria floridensis FSL S10-1187 TaxID=1265817 RepID=A0ABP3B1G5_9LIST|nr:T7SS effector LXG polymorphic toxin [Listeria floridensis]EUJ33774.1 hypothetical protein MFLO_01030 [Listeria floridensis FSL S10-1187]